MLILSLPLPQNPTSIDTLLSHEQASFLGVRVMFFKLKAFLTERTKL